MTATFVTDTVYTRLLPHFPERIRKNEPLARHSAFGVGGNADIWISLETREELISLVRFCAEEHYPLMIVGNGTNILYADKGVRGIVARVTLHSYYIEDNYDGTGILIAESGISWPRLIHELTPRGWGGLEFGVGIPGTLGGGIISNAGAHNDELGRLVEWIEVLDARSSHYANDGEISLPQIHRYYHDELDLSYRHSRFREQRQVRFGEQGQIIVPPRQIIDPAEIVMQIAITLQREEPEKLQEALTQYRQYRQKIEPGQRHAGTVFKDPTGKEASVLIEQVGLKGLVHGKAQIATTNCNYIVNQGGATASDIASLITEAHQRVQQELGISLELDIELRGEWQTH